MPPLVDDGPRRLIRERFRERLPRHPAERLPQKCLELVPLVLGRVARQRRSDNRTYVHFRSVRCTPTDAKTQRRDFRARDAYCHRMAAPPQSRVPSQLVALAIAGIIGAASAGLTSLAADLRHPAGYALHSGLVAMICVAALARPIRAGRPFGWLALAVAIYVAGVFTFPVVGLLLNLDPPAGGLSTINARDVLGMYLFTPIGFLLAAPFSPAVLATALITTKVLHPAEEAWPQSDADRRFRRRTLVAASIVGVLVMGGFGMVFLASQSIGY